MDSVATSEAPCASSANKEAEDMVGNDNGRWLR